MDKIRIGKDTIVRGQLTLNGEPINLTTLNLKAVATLKSDTDVHVLLGRHGDISDSETEEEKNEEEKGYLKVDSNGNFEVCFYGKYQEETGKYIITIWQNYGEIGEAALDVQAFQLVQYTFKENDDNDDLDVSHVDLGTIDITNSYLKSLEELIEALKEIEDSTIAVRDATEELRKELVEKDAVREETFNGMIERLNAKIEELSGKGDYAQSQGDRAKALLDRIGDTFVEDVEAAASRATEAANAANVAAGNASEMATKATDAAEKANLTAEKVNDIGAMVKRDAKEVIDEVKTKTDAEIASVEERVEGMKAGVDEKVAEADNAIKAANNAVGHVGAYVTVDESQKGQYFESSHITGLSIARGDKFYVKVECDVRNHQFQLRKKTDGSTGISSNTLYSNNGFVEITADKVINEMYITGNSLSSVDEDVRFTLYVGYARDMQDIYAATATALQDSEKAITNANNATTTANNASQKAEIAALKASDEAANAIAAAQKADEAAEGLEDIVERCEELEDSVKDYLETRVVVEDGKLIFAGKSASVEGKKLILNFR